MSVVSSLLVFIITQFYKILIGKLPCKCNYYSLRWISIVVLVIIQRRTLNPKKKRKFCFWIASNLWYNNLLYNYSINQLVYEILIGKKSHPAQPCIVLLFDKFYKILIGKLPCKCNYYCLCWISILVQQIIQRLSLKPKEKKKSFFLNS